MGPYAALLMVDGPRLSPNRIYLGTILAIAFMLRSIGVSDIPNGFFNDEAATAYEAYSILKTGRDQHGVFLPLFLRLLGGDYAESLHAFIMVPFIFVLGLNELAARLSSAVVGTLTVLTLYYLTKEFSDNRVALIAAFLLAINPWHIQFSRIAWRAILLPLLVCLALLFFLRSFKNPRYLPVAGLTFGLSLWTYSSARVFVPLFVLGLGLVYGAHLWRYRRHATLAALLFLLVLAPLFTFWITPEGMLRARRVGISTDPALVLRHYVSHFRPRFLFLRGDRNPRHTPHAGSGSRLFGGLYWFESLTVAIGAIQLLRARRMESAFLAVGLLLFPIPGALTAPANALRPIVGTIFFPIVSAHGVDAAARVLQSHNKKFWIAFWVIVLTGMLVFVRQYFVVYPRVVTQWWLYGMREAITYAHRSPYPCVQMRYPERLHQYRSDFLGFVPFYTKYPPDRYHLLPVRRWTEIDSQRDVNVDFRIGKFQMTFAGERSVNEACLIILRAEDVESLTAEGYGYREVHSVRDSVGTEHFKLVELR